LANSGTQIAKRATDGTYVEKKGEAQAKIEAAKVTGVVPGSGANGQANPVTGERPAMRPSQVTQQPELPAEEPKP